MAEIRIRPCVCGAHGTIVSRAEADGHISAYVRCKRCGRAGKAFTDDDCYFVRDAVLDWNRGIYDIRTGGATSEQS